MGFLKKLFNDVGDAIKNNVEERKQEIRQNIEDRKQQFYESIEERKKEVLSKLGVISEETDQQSASIYDAVTSSDDNNCKLDGSIVEETAKNKQEQEHEESMKEDNYPEVGNECKSEILSNPSAEEGGIFSARLESIIAAALQDGVLTDKEREILKRRVEKEGEDWDEVAMIIDARLAEIRAEKGMATDSVPQANVPIQETEDEPEHEDEEQIVGDNEELNDEDNEELNDEDDEELIDEDDEELNDEDDEELIDGDEEELIDEDEEELIDEDEVKDENNGDLSNEKSKVFDSDDFWHLKDKTTIVIPEGVTEIAEKACEGGNDIQSVTFPSTLVRIDEYAFWECKNLISVDFSHCQHLEVIGKGAFETCIKIKEVILPNSIKLIDEHAFETCSSLQRVDFSQCSLLEGVGHWAFMDCSSLQCVDFSQCSLLEYVGFQAFYHCDLIDADFSNCVSLDGFHSNALKKNDHIKTIDFSGCEKLDLPVLDITGTHLEKLILPPGQKTFNAMFVWNEYGYPVDTSKCKNVKIIYTGEFREGEMKEIVIPDSVEIIGEKGETGEYGPFDRCGNLKSIVMPASLKEIKSPLGGYMEKLKKIDFSKVKNLKTFPKIVDYGCYKLKELIIPQGVIEIEDDALNGISKLQRIFLPPSLETFGDTDQKHLSIYCFSPSLEELEPIVYGWDDNDQEDDDELDEIDDEELKQELMQEQNEKKSGYRNKLFVLPQYLKSYIAQRDAEGIPEDVLPIEEMPEEYRYYYDN